MTSDDPASRPTDAPRRGRPPRFRREDLVRVAVDLADAEGLSAVTIRAVAARLGAGTMSVYGYVPDKDTLVREMVEAASAEATLPEIGGNWRRELLALARSQRRVMHDHPWMIDAISFPVPLGPATLAYLEFGLAALEPTGLTAGSRMETLGLLTGFVMNLVRAELAAQRRTTSPQQRAEERTRLGGLLATGRFPRLAAALSAAPAQVAEPPAIADQFDRLVVRVIDGLVSAAGTTDEGLG